VGEQRGRLSNRELAQFENAIAGALAILFDAHKIAALSDDEEVIELASKIFFDALEMRDALILQMHDRRNGA